MSRKQSVCDPQIEYYDGQFDDARYALALAQTAALKGAAVLNYCEVVDLLRNPDTQRVCGATVRDVETGTQERVHARVVMNATGPFTDGVRRMATGAETPPIIRPSAGAWPRSPAATLVAFREIPLLRASCEAVRRALPARVHAKLQGCAVGAGIHITLPDYYSPENVGMIVPKTADGRVVFMLPWAGATIAGTTDAPADVTMTPQAAEDDVAFVLNAIEDFLSVKVRAVLCTVLLLLPRRLRRRSPAAAPRIQQLHAALAHTCARPQSVRRTAAGPPMQRTRRCAGRTSHLSGAACGRSLWTPAPQTPRTSCATTSSPPSRTASSR